jgi:hypothetical protein
MKEETASSPESGHSVDFRVHSIDFFCSVAIRVHVAGTRIFEKCTAAKEGTMIQMLALLP